jgi:hypothetical protein
MLSACDTRGNKWQGTPSIYCRKMSMMLAIHILGETPCLTPTPDRLLLWCAGLRPFRIYIPFGKRGMYQLQAASILASP